MGDPKQSHNPQFHGDLEARIFKITEQGHDQEDLAKAIRQVHLGAGSVVGDKFFPAMAIDLARASGADFIFIGRLDATGDQVQTVAACHRDQEIDNIIYELEGTPCEETISRACCVYPCDVYRKFPEDEMLVEQKAEGYIGVALFDSKGNSVGLIAALYLEPVEDTEFISTLLMAVASRTASEIERQNRDEEKRKLEAQMLSAQKLESLGVLAGGLAHDFNNILATILGSADLAEQDLPAQSPAQKRISVIQTAATSAGELCRQLLAYAGKGRFQVVKADLSQFVLEQEDFLRSTVHKAANLRLDLSDSLPACATDLSQLQQILLNLVINASEALAGTAGEIVIRTGTALLDEKDLKETQFSHDCRSGSFVYLQVQDSGVGMDEALRQKLFDPFFTTKAAGRGLGLSAILGIVRGHQGWVNVESDPGQGSRFTVYLPAIKGKADAAEAITSDENWKGTGTALLVDDDLGVLDVSQEMLRHVGFDVIAVDSGAKAIEVFQRRSHELAVVLLDLTMPEMNGEEVFHRMQALNSQVPVVLTSGFNEQDTVQRFAGSGLAGFLQKPMRLVDLRERIRRALEGRNN